MNFEYTGKLFEIFPTEQKSERFRKREFIIENTSTIGGDRSITDYVKFQATGDKCDLLNKYKAGDVVKVSFNIRGNKWENAGKVAYFTNLDAWRIESAGENNPYTQDGPPASTGGFDVPPPAGDFNDDLPF